MKTDRSASSRVLYDNSYYIYIYIYIYIYKDVVFEDVVFEDVVFDKTNTYYKVL